MRGVVDRRLVAGVKRLGGGCGGGGDFGGVDAAFEAQKVAFVEVSLAVGSAERRRR